MSMIGAFIRIPAVLLNDLKEDHESIEGVLFDEGDSRLSDDARLDIDKSWHIIHFLLTGRAWGGAIPLANAVCGGTALGDVDVGYGPARFLEVQEVADVATAISGITAAELWSRFSAGALEDAQIYPGGTWTADDFPYVAQHYVQLQEFYRVAASRGEAVIAYLS